MRLLLPKRDRRVAIGAIAGLDVFAPQARGINSAKAAVAGRKVVSGRKAFLGRYDQENLIQYSYLSYIGRKVVRKY